MTPDIPNFDSPNRAEEELERLIQTEMEKYATRAKKTGRSMQYDFNNFMLQVCHKLWKSNKEDQRSNPNYANEVPNFRESNFLSDKIKSLSKGEYYNLVDNTARDLSIYGEVSSIIEEINNPSTEKQKKSVLLSDLNNKLKDLYVSLRKQGFNSYDLDAE